MTERWRHAGALGLVASLAVVAAACSTTSPRAKALSSTHHVDLASAVAATEAASTFRFSISEHFLGTTTTTAGVIDQADDASDVILVSTGKPRNPPEEWVSIGTTTWMGPAGEPAQWHSLSGPSSAAIGADGGVDPATVFAKLKAEGLRMDYAGQTTTDGVPTSEYRATMTKAVSIPASMRAKVAGPVDAHGTGTIWIDRQGRVRRFTQRITLSGSKDLAMLFDGTASGTFTDFNSPVTITPKGATPSVTAP